jgi:DNA polymerase III subunit delta'
MIWEQICGQAGAIDTLRRSAASGRLAHALLFVGPPGVGKGLTARTLATALLCQRVPESQFDACGECPSCRMMQAGTHPDFLRVACPEGKSELPIELLVGSRENRGGEGLCHDLALRPMAARRRVAVIDDADRMSNESANALLKTLEEPPSYAVIVLIAADSSKIIPTIRSRCRTVRFQPLESSEVARLVTQLEWAEDPQTAQQAAALSGGSLAVAQQLLNADLRTMRTALFSGLSKPAFQPFTIAQNVLAALDSIGGDTQRQRVHAQCVVRFVIDFYEDALRQWCGVPSDSLKSEEAGAFLQRCAAQEPETAELVGRAIDRAVDAEEQLGGNVAIPLCLEALFSDLATLVGAGTANSSASAR